MFSDFQAQHYVKFTAEIDWRSQITILKIFSVKEKFSWGNVHTVNPKDICCTMVKHRPKPGARPTADVQNTSRHAVRKYERQGRNWPLYRVGVL